MHRQAILAAIWLAASAAPAASTPGTPEPVVSWLVVEANEGGSSGGHTALRIGDEIFHFQHEGGGWLRLRRDRLDAFHHQYALLGNRSVEELRLALTPETRALLRDGFMRRLLAQDAWFEAGAARERDVAWLEALAGEGPPAAVALPGLGFFLPDGDAQPAEPGASRAIAALRSRIVSAQGERFLAERRTSLAASLRDLPLPTAPQSPPSLDPDRLIAFPPSTSDRYRSLETGRFALALLDAAPALRGDALPSIAEPWLALREGEADALSAAAAELEIDLAALVAAPRDDFGPALVLGLARLASIEASLASGRLLLLDAFPDDAPARRIEGKAGARHLAWLERETRAAFERARARALGRRGFRELDWSALEGDASRWRDARGAQETGAALRLARGVLVPSRSALRSDIIAPRASAAALERARAAARASLAAHREALDTLHPYALLSRNCVTELFATIEAALAQAAEVRDRGAATSLAAATKAASQARLGGHIDGARGITFIPSASSAAVAEAYAVRARLVWPSWREQRLAEMRRSESDLVVSLRESNVLSAQAYDADPASSRFLFFGEDASFARPLAGAINLVYGLGQAVAGIVALPFDHGARLYGGLRGALFSLPELALWSLRKGSIAYVDTDDRALDAPHD